MSTTAEAPTAPETPTAPAPATPEELFRFTSWVHVGDGATECDRRLDGKCELEHHFHAWIRLAGPFQARDINEKAKAAQARRLRTLRDPESDAHVILESELDELRDAAERGALDLLVEEILDKDHAEHVIQATRVARDMDDPSWEPPEDDEEAQAPKLYAHIDRDIEEWRRQYQLPEEDRDEDFPQLQKTVFAYNDVVKTELESIREPLRAELAQRGLDSLIDIVRKARREADAAEAYLHTHHVWTMFTCTYKPKLKGTPDEPAFKDFEQMRKLTPPVVIEELRANFDRLNRDFAERTGNF